MILKELLALNEVVGKNLNEAKYDGIEDVLASYPVIQKAFPQPFKSAVHMAYSLGFADGEASARGTDDEDN